MVSLLSLVAIAVFVSSLVVRVVRVCACARWVTLMVYFPAMALPAVVALNAVSYTHLRAHETGRNLVCRLLLEKKKKI